MPFCAIHRLYCDRDVRAGQAEAVMQSYAHKLVHEIHQLAEQIGSDRELMQLHLGGGSANLFSASNLVGLAQSLRQQWRIPSDAELSVECDPRSVGWMQLELLRRLGFDEVHFGVFDLDPQVQKAAGRLHSNALIDDACGLAHQCGVTGIRLSLMAGLPGQVAGQYAIDAYTLPDPAEVPDMVALSTRALSAMGYC